MSDIQPYVIEPSTESGTVDIKYEGEKLMSLPTSIVTANYHRRLVEILNTAYTLGRLSGLSSNLRMER
jgi:hypothetical protein